MATRERRSTGSSKPARKARAPQVTPPQALPTEDAGIDAKGPERRQAQDGDFEMSAEDRRRAEIAKAAYYNAERRGFDGNREVDDWLEAEREVDSRAGAAGIRHEASVTEDAAELPASDDRKGSNGDEIIEPSDIHKWAKKFNVPAERLREAIQRVGPVPGSVERFLAGDSHSE